MVLFLALVMVVPLVVSGGASATNAVGIPIAGDWNADGSSTPGWFHDGDVLLRNADASGSREVSFRFGRAGDVPIVGDWNGDGADSIGVIRGRTWHLKYRNTGGAADRSFIYGRLGTGDYALAGDWNGSGRDGVGIVRNGEWHLRNSLTGGPGDIIFTYGRVLSGDIPVVGDWSADGIDTPGIIRDRTWHLRDVNRGGIADRTFSFGRASDTPLVGNWDGRSGDTPGVVRGITWHLRNSLSGGAAHESFDFGFDHQGEGDTADGSDDDDSNTETDHDHNTETDDNTTTGTHGTWSDPATWPAGRVPTAADDVVIDGHVTLAGQAQAKTVTVTGGSTLEFATGTSSKLEVSGNVVVEGNLKMEPASPDVEHLLRFVNVDEEKFVGGGHAVLDSDVGLWFTGDGRAHIDGSERLAWTRAATSLPKGSRTLQLEQAPTGWRIGDEILITPTSPPGTAGHSTGYSGGRITSISGSTIEVDTPLTYEHPRVDGKWGAEVMNMSRNVQIEGTKAGRAHMMFSHTNQAQTVRNAQLRHLGPRQGTDDTYRSSGERITITEGVMGRYPMHFHHNGAGSTGSSVANVVVRDSGHKAFVAHASDGITFRDTIAHDVFDTPYWWDRRTGCCGRHADWEPPSNNITYDRAIASLVRTDPPFRGYRLAGFELGHGNDVTVMDSVAVGVQGNKNAAGFNWPEGRATESGDSTIGDHWTFQRNVSHNNKVNGIFVWQNTSDDRHLIEDSVLYHNAQHGIDHGAYGNRYRYVGLDLYGNGDSGVLLHAQGEMQFSDLVFDGAGISRYAFRTTKHRSDSGPALLIDSEFSGYTDRAIAFLASEPTRLDIVDPRFHEAEETWFYLSDDVPSDSVIRVQLSDGTAFRLHPSSSDLGKLIDEWNARREPIAPFR